MREAVIQFLLAEKLHDQRGVLSIFGVPSAYAAPQTPQWMLNTITTDPGGPKGHIVISPDAEWDLLIELEGARSCYNLYKWCRAVHDDKGVVPRHVDTHSRSHYD